MVVYSISIGSYIDYSQKSISLLLIIAKRSMQLKLEFKSTRDQYTQQIRRENRHKVFLKKRHQNHMHSEVSSNIQSTIIADENCRHLVQQLQQKQFSFTQIEQLCNSFEHQDEPARLWAVIGIRILLSQHEGQAYLQRIVDSGAVPKLIALMRDRKYPQLQLEATWIITNIAYGSKTQCESIVSKDGVDALLQLLYQNSGCILEQALWGLGNIAGDCDFCRDTVIMKGGVECVVRIVDSAINQAVVSLGCWVLSNLCRGQKLPNYDLIKAALPVLTATLVKGILTGQYLSGCLWALALHSQGSKSKIRVLLKVENFVAKVIDLSYWPDVEIVIPALRILGNISTGSQAQTNELLNNHIIPLLKKLIDHKKRSIRREACWVISNICAGPKQQVQRCIYFPDLVQKLIQMLLVDEHDIKREICYVLGNMCHLGEPEQIYQLLIQFHVLPSLALLIQQDDDVKTIETALYCLYELLGVGAKLGNPNAVLGEVERIPGLIDRIQSLQMHTSPNIYRQLVKIFQRYFNLEDKPF